MRNGVRDDSITEFTRDENERPPPAPLAIRYGMKPPKPPAYGTIGLVEPMPAIAVPEVVP